MTVYGPYPAVVTRVHDGDTCSLVLSLGFGVTFTSNCRVFGINAPELWTPEGKAAAQFAQQTLPVAAPVTVHSHGWDKYGNRFDGDITLPDGRDFAAVMVDTGHAIRKDYT